MAGVYLSEAQNPIPLIHYIRVYSILILIHTGKGGSVEPERRLEDTLAGRRGGWGVNILEDARQRIALLQ